MKKVVLITGASSGIGKQTALLLVRQGLVVYGAARRLDKMQALKESGVRVLQMDVTDDTSMKKGVQEILDVEKRIDVLVNNAGYGSYGALEDVTYRRSKTPIRCEYFWISKNDSIGAPAHEKSKIR